MKKTLLLMVLLLPSFVFACDFCNCYLGLNPQYKKNSIGFRYHFQSYSGTEMSPAELSEMGLGKKDFFENRNEYELHAQYYPVQKLQLIASLPYVYNHDGMSNRAKAALGITHHDMHHEDMKAENVYEGIGDLTLLASYQVFNIVSTDSAGFSHRLLAGPGLRVPTGKLSANEMTEAHEFTHQPGMGSWNPMAGLTYLTRYKKVGTMLNANYLFGTRNKYSFVPGNKLNVNLTAYYELNWKRSQLYPSAGIYWEYAANDIFKKEKVSNSGGSMTYLHVGANWYYRKFALEAAVQLPVQTKVNGYQAENNMRLITGVSFTLN